MINNRQGGRRRGRGGPRPQGMPGNSGNTRDNRQRGNAAQLLEKYKNMARDSQLAGDRVQTEYYLQFADHYFRVLGESRVRFEEQRRQQGDDDGDDDGDELVDADGEGGFEASERPGRRREGREERPERPEREIRRERDERPQREPRRASRPTGNGRDTEEGADAGQRMPVDALPPAIGGDVSQSPEDGKAEPPARPRRARRPRTTDTDGEGATA